jgi:membrane-anchored protein YejM (alkaline phosphatase superfamily)
MYALVTQGAVIVCLVYVYARCQKMCQMQSRYKNALNHVDRQAGSECTQTKQHNLRSTQSVLTIGKHKEAWSSDRKERQLGITHNRGK